MITPSSPGSMSLAPMALLPARCRGGECDATHYLTDRSQLSYSSVTMTRMGLELVHRINYASSRKSSFTRQHNLTRSWQPWGHALRSRLSEGGSSAHVVAACTVQAGGKGREPGGLKWRTVMSGSPKKRRIWSLVDFGPLHLSWKKNSSTVAPVTPPASRMACVPSVMYTSGFLGLHHY